MLESRHAVHAAQSKQQGSTPRNTNLPVLTEQTARSLPAIDPHRLGQGVLQRTVGVAAPYSDLTTLALYNIGRKLVNDVGLGTHYTNDVLGCNHRCAHCWVHTEALNGNTANSWVANKLNGFPKRFRGEAVQEADQIFDYVIERVRSLPNTPHVIGFGGGEPLQYRGGLRRFGERAARVAQVEPLFVSVDTTAFQIAEDPGYLDAFEGLQDVMQFYVSLKAVSPGSFQRFTGLKPEYHDHAFKGLEALLRRGFTAIPGGIVLNTYFHPEEFSAPIDPIRRLHARLSAIHPDLPRTVSYHKVTFGMVHEPGRQSERMLRRGYGGSSPSEFAQLLESYFNDQGTPIIETLKQHKGVPGIITKKETFERIIGDLRSRSA